MIYRKRPEDPVPVGKAAISHGDHFCRCAVDENHWPRGRRLRRQIFRNTRLPLVPPNPKELDNATPIFILRAVFGT